MLNIMFYDVYLLWQRALFTMFKILTSCSVPMGWTPQQSGGLVARGWEAKLAQGQRGLGTKTRAAPTQPGLAGSGES